LTGVRIESAPLEIAGSAGPLEAVLERAPDLVQHFGCVVCHPHPLHAGTMHNKVVTTVARAVARNHGTSLRFNYRGVGASAGAYDGGRGELEDALAAVRQLRGIIGSAAPVIVAGFSFGGAIAYRVAAESNVDALITIAPAWERIPATTRANPRSWLLLQGGDDEIIPAAGVFAWAHAHEARPQIEEFESTGHFFHGRLPQLADAVAAFISANALGRREQVTGGTM
jgi:alpha/beta superfamily hydrolase